jgi:hypothetical protein
VGVEFMQAFIAAWLEGTHNPHIFTARERFIEIWGQGEFALICFSARKSKNMRSALQEKREVLEAKAITVPFENEEFVAQMHKLSDEDVQDVGSATAGTWALLHVQKMHDEVRRHAAGIEDSFGDFSIDEKPSAMNLKLVDWKGELVSAVLRDIDDGVQQKKTEKNEGAYCMEKSIALKLMRSQRIDEDVAVVGDGGEDAVDE